MQLRSSGTPVGRTFLIAEHAGVGRGKGMEEGGG
jgi:hypothetical protein